MTRYDWVVLFGHIVVILELVYLVYVITISVERRRKKGKDGATQDKS